MLLVSSKNFVFYFCDKLWWCSLNTVKHRFKDQKFSAMSHRPSVFSRNSHVANVSSSSLNYQKNDFKINFCINLFNVLTMHQVLGRGLIIGPPCCPIPFCDKQCNWLHSMYYHISLANKILLKSYYDKIYIIMCAEI